MHPIYSRNADLYDFGPGHPFSPLRQKLVLHLLRAESALPTIVEPPAATHSEVLSVHTSQYVDSVQAASSGQADHICDSLLFGLGTPDVPVFEGMDAATRHVVGGTLLAARIAEPGRATLHFGGGLHHAQREHAAGFCVYNDVAIAILDLLERGYRVAYLDIDAHHGDGVQNIFYHDPRVLTISLHESGRYIFPGTGFVDEIGDGAGHGYALNVPLMPTTGHESYLEVFDMVVPQALSRFAADILVVECGADAHAADPLAHLRLSTQTFEEIFRRIISMATEHCHDHLVLHLGGGYNMDATVRIWAMLALIALGEDIPERLPNSWVSLAQQETGMEFSGMWHDITYAKAGSSVAARNRREALSLLELTEGLF